MFRHRHCLNMFVIHADKRNHIFHIRKNGQISVYRKNREVVIGVFCESPGIFLIFGVGFVQKACELGCFHCRGNFGTVLVLSAPMQALHGTVSNNVIDICIFGPGSGNVDTVTQRTKSIYLQVVFIFAIMVARNDFVCSTQHSAAHQIAHVFHVLSIGRIVRIHQNITDAIGILHNCFHVGSVWHIGITNQATHVHGVARILCRYVNVARYTDKV